METAKLTGIDLQYDMTGSADPVLLISIGPIADSFLPFVSEKALAGRYRLIRYRQRRMSASNAGSAAVSFAQHASDAAALLGHLGISRAHVAGHSTGAAIALQLTLDHPEIVRTLVLLEPPLISVPSAALFFEKAGPALAAYGSGDRDGALAGFMSVVCSLDWETCRALVERHVPGGVAQAMKDADDFFTSYLPALGAWQFGPEQAAAISQPVLSVLGAQTQQLFAESHDLLHDWFPQLEECVIEGVAHLLHMQRPEPVARCVSQFFARHPIDSDQSTREARESVLA